MGATTEHTATEAAGALKFLAAAGFSAKKSIAALPGTLNLATAGQVALAEATDITTDVLTAFGLQVEELSRVNDAFITTSSSSNTNVLMLGQSMKMVAPTAKLFGLTVEQTAAFLGTLANAGVKAEMAGSGLNMVLLKSARAAKKLGLEAGTPLIEVLKKMKEAQWGAVEIGEAFGARQVKTAAILMDGIANYEKLTQKILDNVGATKKLADIIRDGLDVDIKTLNSTIEEELLRIFDKYKDDIREVVQSTTEWIRLNPQLIDNLGSLIKAMLNLAVAMGKVVGLAAEFTGAWIDVWRAMGLYSAGVIDFTTATQDSTHALKIFNEEMGPKKLRLTYLERIIASGKYTWQVEKEIKVLKALIESRKTFATLKAPGRLEEALEDPSKYYGALPDIPEAVIPGSEQLERTKEYYKQLEVLAQEKRDFILELEDEETRMFEENLDYRLELKQQYYKDIEAVAQEARDIDEEMENQKMRMAAETAAYQKELNAQRLSDIQSSISMMTQGFQTISEMGGKHSKEAFAMYKGFKIIETTIATYSAAIKAYESLVGIPIVGPFIAPAAAAAAVAFGMAQVAMIKSAQPPSYDQGGISNAEGLYRTGPIREAHIPIPSGGKIPVKVEGKEKQTVQIIMNNPTFQDLETQRQVMVQIASVVAAQVAPGAIIENYENDLGIRQMVRGGI